MNDEHRARVEEWMKVFWADVDRKTVKSRDAYLRDFPGLEREIDEELSFLAKEDGSGGTSDSEARIGPYRLLKELGHGGQGSVYLAEDTRLGRRVALKVLSPGYALSATALLRFRAEAERAAKVNHPGLAQIYEWGGEEDQPYLAMEFVEGRTLAEHLKDSATAAERKAELSQIAIAFESQLEGSTEKAPPCGKDSAGQVVVPPSPKSDDPATEPSSGLGREAIAGIVSMIESAARALHAAHEGGLVHRDIKPGNLMVTKDRGLVIIDFGMASDEDSHGASLTMTGDLLGTPAYMSPEQLAAQRIRVDRRSDVYSLGVTLYECLALRRPFQAPSRELLYREILSKEAPNLHKLNPAVSEDLRVIVSCAMEKDADRRYQTALEFAEDLRRLRDCEPIRARPVGPVGRLIRWSRRQPAAAALLATLLLGVPSVSLLGAWYWRHHDDVISQERARIEEEVEDALEAGFFEMHEGTPELAVAAFTRALSSDPGSAEAVLGLALAQMRRGSPEDALRAITEGERRLADPRVLARTKSEVLMELGREAEARVALESSPDVVGPLMCFLEGARAIDAGHRKGEISSEGQAAFQAAAEYFTRAVAASPRARRAYHTQLAHAIGHLSPGDARAGEMVAAAIGDLWPAWAGGWFWSGFAMRSTTPDRALAAYREAIRLDPGDASAQNNLGYVLNKQGKRDEAVAAFREATRLDPSNAQSHVGLGNIFFQQGKLDEAVAALKKAIRLDPSDARDHTNLGVALVNQGKLDEAVAAHQEAIRIDSDYAPAHSNLGFALMKQGKLDDSVAACREAIGLDSGYAPAHNNLGVALERQDKLDEAVAAYREAIGLDAGYAQFHFNLGVALNRQGKLDEAVAAYLDAIELDPVDAGFRYNLGHALQNQGKLDEAVAAYEAAIRLDKRHARAYSDLGILLAYQGQLDKAVAAYRLSIEIEPSYALAHTNLGIVLQEQGKLDDAVNAHRNAIDLDPDDARFHNNLASTLAEQGKLDEAIKACQVANGLDPGLPQARGQLQMLLRRAGRTAELLRLLREEVERRTGDSGDASAHTNLGIALESQGKLDEAVEAYRDAIDIDSGDAGIHVHLGIALSRMGKLDEAVKAYRQSIEIDPRLAVAHTNLGNALGNQGKLDEAVAAHLKAIDLDPSDARFHSNLGNVLHKQGKTEEAIASYRAAIRLDPDLPQARSNLRAVLRSAGMTNELILLLREDVQRSPDDPNALNSLAWELVDPDGDAAVRDPAEAVPLARKAVEHSSRLDVSILDTLAVALAANSELKEAVAVQEEILKLMNGKEVQDMTVADAEAALDRYRKALAATGK